jgi:ClpP class serine protease
MFCRVVPWSRRYATVLRMLGPKKTIEYITQSKKLTAEQALKDGLVDEICGPEDDIVVLAKTGYELRDVQPWDNKKFKVPELHCVGYLELLNFQCFECDGV